MENTFGHISAAIPAVPVAQFPAPLSSEQSAQERDNSKKRRSSFSSSSGFSRIPRKRNRLTVGRNEAQISTHRTNDARGLRRLRKTHQDQRPHRVNKDAEPLNRNVTHIPDAMSEKVCVVARRCQRLFHKNYNFVEENVCASSGAFVLALLRIGRARIPVLVIVILNAARAPLGREAMRGNDFSNTVFIEDSSPSRKGPICNNGEKVIQSTFPIGSSFNLHVLSDQGLLGSGSTDPIFANESVRVCRPPSIPVPDVDDGTVCQPPSILIPDVDGGMMHQPSSRIPSLPVKEPDYESLQNAVTEYYTQVNQLKAAHHQQSLACGVDADMRQEITRLERKITELSAAIKVLTEELAGARLELANSKSRELQLQLYLEEIEYVLPDSWEY
ncbi:hypothetical protein MKX03_026120 [Papaver bracteatum]|nr:hypothetical protein MKX03_026120 [Papaver bracteatum]